MLLGNGNGFYCYFNDISLSSKSQMLQQVFGKLCGKNFSSCFGADVYCLIGDTAFPENAVVAACSVNRGDKKKELSNDGCLQP